MTGFLLAGMLDLTADEFELKKLDQAQIKKILQFSLWDLEALQHWDGDHINDLLAEIANFLDMKLSEFLLPLFVAISGKSVSPPLFDSMEVLGPDLSRARIRHAIDVLGGVSKKENKRLEKEYRGLKKLRP
jgi:glutamyl-tRNA synthetase